MAPSMPLQLNKRQVRRSTNLPSTDKFSKHILFHICCIMRKNAFCIWEKQRSRSAVLLCKLISPLFFPTSIICHPKFQASSHQPGLIVPDLVGNAIDWFSLGEIPM